MKQIITLVFIVISCNLLSSQIDVLEVYDTCPYEESGRLEVELSSNSSYPEFPYFVEVIGDGHEYYGSFEIFSLVFQVENLPFGDYVTSYTGFRSCRDYSIHFRNKINGDSMVTYFSTNH